MLPEYDDLTQSRRFDLGNDELVDKVWNDELVDEVCKDAGITCTTITMPFWSVWCVRRCLQYLRCICEPS